MSFSVPKGSKDMSLPSMFYEVAETIPDGTAERVRDLVIAAYKAPDANLPTEEKVVITRITLRPTVQPYANKFELDVDMVCDMLVGLADITASGTDDDPAMKDVRPQKSTM